MARLFEIYDAFVEGRLERIPDYFDAHGFYRTSGVFPGMRERYVGHDEIREFWHAATEPWESLQIEIGHTMARGEDVVAQIWLTGRGRQSRVEVKGVEAGHLVRFRELKIVEFLAFATWDLAVEHLEGLAGVRARLNISRSGVDEPVWPRASEQPPVPAGESSAASPGARCPWPSACSSESWSAPSSSWWSTMRPRGWRCSTRSTRSSTTASWSDRRCCASLAARLTETSGWRGRWSASPSRCGRAGTSTGSSRSPIVADAPYPSVADGFWLGFLPVCYVGVLLLARKRLPHLDSRLWLDGIIAALTTGAISAAVIFGAVHASTGGDTAAVATNLAYPLGDMILLGIVIGAMAAGRGRLDRSWLYFGAGIAVFAVTDSVYLLQVAKGTYVARHAARRRMASGHAAGRRSPPGSPLCASVSPATSSPASSSPIGLGLASLVLLIYDHFEQTNLLALGLAAAALVAVLIRLSLTHRAKPHQPRPHARAGAHRLPHRTRESVRAAPCARPRVRRAGDTPHVLLMLRSRRLQELQRLLRAPGGRRAAGQARGPAGRRDRRRRARRYRVGGRRVLACSRRGRPTGRPGR